MKTMPLKPERQAELEDLAQRRGKTPAEALDEALAAYLEWERQDLEEAVRGSSQGYEDVKAGRTRPCRCIRERLKIPVTILQLVPPVQVPVRRLTEPVSLTRLAPYGHSP
jgi:predicted transcriptional regulator